MDVHYSKNCLDDDRKVHKCNQCDSVFSCEIPLRTHFKTHSGDKSNKCNQCDYAPSQVSNLRTHLKTRRKEEKEMHTDMIFVKTFTRPEISEPKCCTKTRKSEN